VQSARGPVSSTAIRDAIRAGDLAAAEEMLGRPFSVLGTVVRGDGRGRTLGAPTANLDLAREIRPPRGVYIGRATLPDGGDRYCLVNVGGRPTFQPEGSAADTVEAWIPDWEGDLYGRALEVAFLARLRDERKFAGAEELREQIRADHVSMVEWIRRVAGARGRSI
jgi:riboflavin kinase/FMN adenylyltransferase